MSDYPSRDVPIGAIWLCGRYGFSVIIVVSVSGDRRGEELHLVTDVTATDAARDFADLLDGVERRGEHCTIVRRGKAVAHLEPVASGLGADVKSLLRRHVPDKAWPNDLTDLRALVEIEDRR